MKHIAFRHHLGVARHYAHLARMVRRRAIAGQLAPEAAENAILYALRAARSHRKAAHLLRQ